VISLLIILLNILLILFINNYFIKKDILIDKKKLKHKSFISENYVPISGGFLIFINLLFSNDNYLVIFFYFVIFVLGVFSDLFIIKSPNKKIIIQFLIIFLFLFFLKISIISTKVFFIDYLIENKLFALLFTTLCFLVLLNGSNFLDGINTLVCGYYILVILTVLYLDHYNTVNYNFQNFYYLLLPLIVIFLFNFFSKTYLGDSGTFLLGFSIGYYLVNMSNKNLSLKEYISPAFILLLLWYPVFENLFSIIRKFYMKKSPTKPDNLHLHHLIFLYLNSKIINKSFSNTLTGLCINFYNLLIFILAVQLYNKTNLIFLLVGINIFIYVFCYLFLFKKKLNIVNNI
jgi:UDP-N-acetylmuramyl pentapeptide phosphotransferase/UDP-N-acetylglucosamine-1-phosphate transferase